MKLPVGKPTEFPNDPRLSEIERLRVNAAPAVRRALDGQAESIKRELKAKADEELEYRDDLERRPDLEVARLRANPERWRPFLVRTLRILCGMALAASAWWIFDTSPDIGSTPLAALTLRGIVFSLLHWVLALWAAVSGIVVAFGAGQGPVSESVLRERATEIVRHRR
jgi:hypothetical protein